MTRVCPADRRRREDQGLRRSSTAICLAWLRGWGLFAFASAIGVLGLVPGTLCLGADGHVAIEAAQAGRCIGGEATPEAPPAPELSAPPPASHCGPCTDLTA